MQRVRANLPRIYENNVARRTENSTREFAIDEMLTGEYLPTETNGLCAYLFDLDDATRAPLRPLASRESFSKSRTATPVVVFLLVDSDDQTSANEGKLRSGNLTNLGNDPRSWELDSREEVLLEKALAPSQRRQLDDKDRGARSIFPLLVDENARIAFLRREMERRNCFSSYRW